MAKISFEMDTVEKTYTLTIDGEAVENVIGLSAYMGYPYDNDGDGDGDDKCSISIERCTRDDEEGLRRHERICASEKEGVTVKETQKPVFQHISDFLSTNRNHKAKRR